MAPYDLHYQPKDLIPNVVWAGYDVKLSTEEEETLKDVIAGFDPSDIRQLCRSCGWTSQHEVSSSYLSRLRVVRAKKNSGLWSMGNDWAVWDRTEEQSGNDYMTHQFLRNQGTKHIPLVKEMVEFKDEDGRYNFVVMSRAKGVQLDTVWNGLSREEKESYAQQITAALREMRQFTAEHPQRVDGSPLRDVVIGICRGRKLCKKIGKTTEDWFNNLDEELREGIARNLQSRDKTEIDAKLQELKQNFPDGAPYVLTHASINSSNILVHDGKVEAIVDWKFAGYYPWWVEVYTSYNNALSDANFELLDMEWGELNMNSEMYWKNVKPVIQAWGSCPMSIPAADKTGGARPFANANPSVAGLCRTSQMAKRNTLSIITGSLGPKVVG